MDKSIVMKLMDTIRTRLDQSEEIRVLGYLNENPQDEETLYYIINNDLVEIDPFAEEVTDDTVITGIKPSYKNYLNNVKDE